MQKHAIEWNLDPASVTKWGLGGAALGAGARLAKYLADVARNRDVSSAVKVKKTISPVAEIPVDVSEEEAADLARQGIKVKTAAVTDVLAGAGLGALGTAAAYGGWRLLDSKFDEQRKAEAKKQLGRARRRVERLLTRQPEAQDIKIAAAMEAAEEVYFKEAGIMDSVVTGAANMLSTPLTYVAPGIGAIATLAAVAGYNRAKESNKNTQKAKALRNMFVDNRVVETPQASMVPVLRKKPATGGSPAQQAAE